MLRKSLTIALLILIAVLGAAFAVVQVRRSRPESRPASRIDPTTVHLPASWQVQGMFTFQGKAGESKEGLFVGGILLDSLEFEDIEKYRGRTIRVIGKTLTIILTRCPEDPSLYACTGETDTPVLRDIASIEIL